MTGDAGMGLFIQRSVEGLGRVRHHVDGGWGRRAGRGRSVTVTAEVMLALAGTRVLRELLDDPNVPSPLEILKNFPGEYDNNKHTNRHIALVLLALLRNEVRPTDGAVIFCAKQLNERNITGQEGWGYTPNDTKAYTYPTCLATWALLTLKQKLEKDPSAAKAFSEAAITVEDIGHRVEEGMEWILGAANDQGGWGFRSRDRNSNAACTSYGVFVLGLANKLRTEQARAALTFLRGGGMRWELIGETVHGTKKLYMHCTPAWVIMAFQSIRDVIDEDVSKEFLISVGRLTELCDTDTGLYGDGDSSTAEPQLWETAWAIWALRETRDAATLDMLISAGRYVEESRQMAACDDELDQRRIEGLIKNLSDIDADRLVKVVKRKAAIGLSAALSLLDANKIVISGNVKRSMWFVVSKPLYAVVFGSLTVLMYSISSLAPKPWEDMIRMGSFALIACAIYVYNAWDTVRRPDKVAYLSLSIAIFMGLAYLQRAFIEGGLFEEVLLGLFGE